MTRPPAASSTLRLRHRQRESLRLARTEGAVQVVCFVTVELPARAAPGISAVYRTAVFRWV